MANITREFSVEELEEDYDLPWKAISDTELDKRRWYTVRELIFQADDDLYYSVAYMDPATENQDGQDRWDMSYPDNMVEAFQVQAKEVVTIKWVPVKAQLIKD